MKRILFILATLVLSLNIYAQSLTVSAPNVVSLDETIRVVFTADGSISDFSWDVGSDFDVVWGPQRGSSSSTQIINGKRTSSHTESYTYLLQAKSTGKFTLQPAYAKVEKKDVSTKSVTIEVVSASQNATVNQQQQSQSSSQSATNVSGNDIYMKLLLNKTNVVKGEPIIATLKLYTRVDISGFEDVKFPTFTGFWSKEIEAPQNIEFNRENVDGQIYNSAVLRKYMLIPQQTGILNIDQAEMIIQTRVSTQSSGPRSIFDDFFDSYQTVRKRVYTPETKINVKALPSGAPASFAGGVGDFKMTTEFSSSNLKSNEAGSLIVTISGKGNISMLEAPKINFPPDFEVYDIKSSENISTDGTSGTKRFEFPFIPRSHGDFKLDPIEYAYYDISSGKYVTLSNGGIDIHIEKGEDVDNGGVVMSGVTRQSVKNLAEDVRFISRGVSGLRQNGKFFAVSPIFFMLVAILILLFFAADILLKKFDERRKDVLGSKNRRANKLARARLHQASVYKDKNLSTAYYEELHKALLGYISDKLFIPVADLSKDTIAERLKESGVKQELIDSFLAIVDACEYARYAPDADGAAMENQYNDALTIISDLESSMKYTSKKSSKVVAVIGVLMLGTINLSAQSETELWNSANDAYAAGQYQDALNNYQMIEASGLVSSDLFYNIGNTYFKMGDNSYAILYFERSLKYNPSNKDAANNLQIAKQFTLDKIEEIPDLLFVSWVKDVKYLLSADGWAVVSIIMLGIALLCFLAFKHAARGQKASFIFGCILILFTIFSFIFSVSEKRDIITIDSAIVMQPVSTVKSSPGDAGKTLFMLHEGTKVSILDNLGEWTNIELGDGRQGWIASSEIEGI